MQAFDSTHAERDRAGQARPAQERAKIVGSQPRGEHVRHATPSAQAVARADDALAAQLMRAVRERAERALIQRVPIGTPPIEVDKRTNMASWEQGGVKYHLNTTTDPPHVTQEGRSKGKKSGATKTHFFFEPELTASGYRLKNAVSGQSGKKKFSDLPQAVQNFVEANYSALL